MFVVSFEGVFADFFKRNDIFLFYERLRYMRGMSLKYRILLPIIGIIVVGIAVTAAISSKLATEIISSLTNAQLLATTEATASQVGNWVEDLRKKQQTLSEFYLFNVLLDEAKEVRSADVQQANAEIDRFVRRFDDFESALLFDTRGHIVAASDPKLVGQQQRGEANLEFMKKSQRGEQAISGVIASTVTGDPVFVIATPVLANRQVVGILGAAVSLKKFTEETISPIRFGHDGYAFLVDETGLVAAHPDLKAVLSLNLNEQEWGKDILARKNGFFTYKYDGVEKIAAFRTDPRTDWVIVSTAMTKDIYAAVSTLNRSNLMAGLIVVVIGIVSIFLIVNPMARAIKQASGFSLKIQRGDLAERLNLKRKDEIGQLGLALDTMADRQQQRAGVVAAIAKGDLTREIVVSSENDVLGHALRSMTGQLNETLTQIRIASDQIDSGSTQVSDSAQDLSQGSTEQASAIEQIGASLVALSSRTQLNAENAATANQLAMDARRIADDGNSQMQQMVSAMQEINEAGQDIGKIIKTIDEIAFQTNLLALNAAVEAARAGQHGKGFAVVAEEVRSLAARSAKAAQETAELIEGSVLKGERGTGIANKTAEALAAIVDGIEKTSELVAEIAASSKEQAVELSQVNEGLAQVDHVVQRNTAGAEESAAAAEELSSQSEHMRGLIAQFQLKSTALALSADNDD